MSDERAHKRHRDETFRRMMADRDVSDQARVLGAHVYLLGKAKAGGYRHEIGHRDFAVVNSGKADDETIRRRLRQLEARGYLRSYRNGPRNPLYEFAPSLEQGESESQSTTQQGSTAPFPHTSAGDNGSRPLSPTPEQGESPPPSPGPPSPIPVGDGSVLRTTPPPPPPCATRDLLAEMMGLHAAAAFARVDAMPGAPADWASQLWAFYRPPDPASPTDAGGTQWAAIAKVPADRVGAVLANAMTDFTTNCRDYNGRALRSYVENAVAEEVRRTTPRPARNGGGGGYGRPRPRPMDELPEGFTATKKFEGFKR